jgi:hypothetical protein
MITTQHQNRGGIINGFEADAASLVLDRASVEFGGLIKRLLLEVDERHV